MRRRKFLIGAGSLAAGGAAAVGTGAFSNTAADRSVSVDVVGDLSAYLRLASTSPYTENSGELDIDFSENGIGGEGLNSNSVVSFDELFRIENQGTETVAIYFDSTDLVDALDANGISGSQGWFPSPYPSGENFDEDEMKPENIDLSGPQNDPSFDISDIGKGDGRRILDPGDSVGVGWFIVTDENTNGSGVTDAELTIQGYSAYYAWDQQFNP